MTDMEHLPYGGSSRVATKDDIAVLRADIDHIDQRFEQMCERMDRSDRRFVWFATIITAAMFALFAVQVQIMFSIANLSAALNK